MPIKRETSYDSGHFFIIFTFFNWIPLVEITKNYNIVYHWFDHLKSKGHFIIGYVIMPNHIHATIAFTKTKKRINKIISDRKRFIRYEIIKRLEQQGAHDI